MGFDGKTPAFHWFTDERTGGSFAVKDISKLAELTKAKREEFKAGKGVRFAPADEMSRKDLQAAARRIGMPATVSSEKIREVLRVLQKSPSTWTKDELKKVAGRLYLHQIYRGESVAKVEQEGLTAGMVDRLDAFLGSGFTFNQSLKKPTALFLAGDLTFRSADSGRISKTKRPIAMIDPDGTIKKGDGAIDTVHGALRDPQQPRFAAPQNRTEEGVRANRKQIISRIDQLAKQGMEDIKSGNR